MHLRPSRPFVRAARRVVLPALAAATLLATYGCMGRRVVVPVALDPPTLAAPIAFPDLHEDRAAVRAVARVIARDLRLPVPEHVTVYVYTSRATFERGLVDDARVSPVRAAELSGFAAGIGKRRQLLLHQPGGAARGPEWLRLIAHEMAHVVQIELAQGEGRAEQWLAEGMAEWVAFQVLERLGVDTVARRHAAAVRGVRGHAPIADGRLDLLTLGSPRGYTLRHLRDGSKPTYQLAFLMADYLIAREGLDRVLEYFRDRAARRDRDVAFEAAFGEPIGDFEGSVLGHLRALVD